MSGVNIPKMNNNIDKTNVRDEISNNNSNIGIKKNISSSTKRCQFGDCNKKILSLAIDCDKCHGFYCGSHRIPECHSCEKLLMMKKEAHELNKVNLENNRVNNVNKALGAY